MSQSSRDIHSLSNLLTVSVGYRELASKDLATAIAHLERALRSDRQLITILKRLQREANTPPGIIATVLGG